MEDIFSWVGGFCGIPDIPDEEKYFCPMYDLERNDPNHVEKCSDCRWFAGTLAADTGGDNQ